MITETRDSYCPKCALSFKPEDFPEIKPKLCKVHLKFRLQENKRYNELLRLEEDILYSRCPDGRKGCLVAHGTQSIIDKLQATLNEQRELSKDWGPVGIKFRPNPIILNDEWITNLKVKPNINQKNSKMIKTDFIYKPCAAKCKKKEKGVLTFCSMDCAQIAANEQNASKKKKISKND